MKTFFAVKVGLIILVMCTATHAADIDVSADIAEDTTFTNNNRYIITTEVHVKTGVTLTIENNTQILIRNGVEMPKKPTSTRRPSFVFDAGSVMLAEDVYFRACDNNNQSVKIAQNAGLFFIGSSSMTRRDMALTTELSIHPSNFKARSIHAEYLGSRDPWLHQNAVKNLSKTQKMKLYGRIDDNDAIQLIGLNASEWEVGSIYSIGSGDDGFDLEDCVITLNQLHVSAPTEDGLNMTNSRIDINENLEIDVGITGYRDRDLFDLEVDRSPSVIRIAKNAQVKLNGIFGDQTWLRSNDLPPKNKLLYKFNGKALNGQSYIYSMNQD